MFTSTLSLAVFLSDYAYISVHKWVYCIKILIVNTDAYTCIYTDKMFKRLFSNLLFSELFCLQSPVRFYALFFFNFFLKYALNRYIAGGFMNLLIGCDRMICWLVSIECKLPNFTYFLNHTNCVSIWENITKTSYMFKSK